MSQPQVNNPASEARAVAEQNDAEVFEERSERYTTANAAILDAFHSSFMPCDNQEQQQFIDVGCGIGDLTLKHLLPRCSPFRRLVAVDCSDNLIKLAAKKYPHPKVEYMQLDIVGDVEGFVREQGEFHRVYSFSMLHWVKDKRLAMHNFEKLLSPGGELFLVMLAGSLIHDLYKAMMKSPRWAKYTQVLEECMPVISAAQDKESLRKYAGHLLKFTKLTPLTCEVISYPSTSRTKEEMIQDFLLFNHIKPLLNDKEKEELREFIAEFTEKIWVATRKGEIVDRKMIVLHAHKPLK